VWIITNGLCMRTYAFTPVQFHFLRKSHPLHRVKSKFTRLSISFNAYGARRILRDCARFAREASSLFRDFLRVDGLQLLQISLSNKDVTRD
jgi:hypothetical protein